MISTTSREANKEATPIGTNTTVTSKNVDMTHFGVKIGLHAGSSCWVNFEYLGRLEILVVGVESVAEPEPPAVALIFYYKRERQTETKRKKKNKDKGGKK
jgi:hypothetical protein